MTQLLKTVVDNLNKRGFAARYCATAAEAADVVLAAIHGDATVGIGGSVTIDQLGIFDRLIERGQTVFWHWKQKPTDEVRHRANQAEVYLCSVNALMKNGEMVSVDGAGNRLAGMLYGPDHCIIVIGRNKLVDDYESAIDRIKTVACPQNARRLNGSQPCGKTDRCADCSADLRMCRATVIYSYPYKPRRVEVIVVGEDMGF